MPAVSSEPTRDHMRLTEDQVDMIAEEFHESRLTQNPKASLYIQWIKIWGFPKACKVNTSVNTGVNIGVDTGVDWDLVF